MLDKNRKYKTLDKALTRINQLENYIRDLSEMTDTCVEDVLREICRGCRCGKADKQKESNDGHMRNLRKTD